MFNTIFDDVEDVLVVNKSKFIVKLYHIKDEENVNFLLDKLRKEHYKANHHVYAYILENDLYKCSDDGEPSKTAGLPALNILRTSNLENVLVVIIRYFGGIKLGTGGLTRAYSEATKKAVNNANILNAYKKELIGYEFEYSFLGKIQNFINSDASYIIKEIIYLDKIKVLIYCDEDLIDNLSKKIIDITSNNVKISYIDKFILYFDKNKKIIKEEKYEH